MHHHHPNKNLGTPIDDPILKQQLVRRSSDTTGINRSHPRRHCEHAAKVLVTMGIPPGHLRCRTWGVIERISGTFETLDTPLSDGKRIVLIQ